MLYYSLSSSKSLSEDCASNQLSSSAVTRPLAVTLPTKIRWISGCLPAATLAPPRTCVARRLSHPPCPHVVPPAAALCNRATVRGTTAAVTTCIAAESAGNGCAPADKLLRRRKTSSESSAYGKSPMAGTYCCHRGCRLTGSTGPSGRGLAAPPPPVGGDYPDLCAASDIIACVRGGVAAAAAAAVAHATCACMADFRDIFFIACAEL